MVTALGVAQDVDGNGLDALTHRRILAAHYENTGVVEGLEVSGDSGLRYKAASGVAVCSDGLADGFVEAYWPGGPTEEAVSAGDSAYPRIDTVYLLADTKAGGQVSLHVAEGTPSASTPIPHLPSAPLPLRSFVMPAGAASTMSATYAQSMEYAIPYGGSLGRLGYAQRTDTDGLQWASMEQHQLSLTTSRLSTDRLVDVVWAYRASTSGGIGSFVANLYVDDQPVSDGKDECAVFEPWARQSCRWRVALAGGDTHKVHVAIKPAVSRPRWWWRGFRSLEVTDVGVSR